MNDLIKFLTNHNLTISTAESCTGGLIAKMITDIPGASDCFGMGVVTYSNEAKQNLLGVKTETLAQYGAVSAQTAAEMCEGMRALSGADAAVAVTGIAGPGGGTVEKPVGLVYVGISGANGTQTFMLNLAGNRDEIRVTTAQTALEAVYEYMILISDKNIDKIIAQDAFF